MVGWKGDFKCLSDASTFSEKKKKKKRFCTENPRKERVLPGYILEEISSAGRRRRVQAVQSAWIPMLRESTRNILPDLLEAKEEEKSVR